MKISCRCGSLILDGTDDLPHKAHVVPDQIWLSTHEALDAIVEAAADGRLGKDAACHRARELFERAARLAWQCHSCGRLLLDGRDGGLRSFVPEGETLDREILRAGDLRSRSP